MKKLTVGENQDFATLEELMQNLKNIDGDITVVLENKTYFLDSPLYFTANETKNRKIIFEGSEKTVFSGGVAIEGWKPFGDDGIWVAPAPVENFRRLYVNGKSRSRARSEGTVVGDYYQDKNIISVDAKKFPEIKSNPANVEAVWEKAMWRHCRHGVENLWVSEPNKFGDVRMFLQMKQPYYAWGSEMGGGDEYTPSPKNPFYLENALEFLTDEGEWCFDRAEQLVYYKPYANENMKEISVIAPKTEQLVKICGTDLDNRASNVTFQNISFIHAAWNRPTDKGFSTIQAQMLNASSECQAVSEKEYVIGAVELNFAENIAFDGCRFSMLGGDAVRIIDGVKNATVKNSHFSDISSGAFHIGLPEHQMSETGNRYISRGLLIENNYITDTGNEFPSSPAIMIYFTADSVIRGNEIFDVPYTGISLGWGWVNPVPEIVCCNNLIEYNCIHDFMKVLCDGGGVYTLGRQKNCVIRYNYFYDIVNFHASVYTDNGSTNMDIYGNVNENVRRFDFSWEPSIENISVHDNYTDSYCSLMDATNSSTYNNFYFPRGFMCDEACEIVAKCGIGHNIEKKGVKGLKFDTDFYIEKNEKYKTLGIGEHCSMQGLTIEFEEKKKIDKIFFDLYEYHQPRVVTVYLVSDSGEYIKAGTCFCPENAGYIILPPEQEYQTRKMFSTKKVLFTVETDFNNGLMPLRNIFFI